MRRCQIRNSRTWKCKRLQSYRLVAKRQESSYGLPAPRRIIILTIRRLSLPAGRVGQPSPGSDELLSDGVNPVPFLS